MKKILILLMLSMFLLNGCITEEKQIVKTKEVSIKDFEFTPKIIEINKGETVTWTNNDDLAHRISFNDVDSGDFYLEEKFQYKFEESGVYEYICAIHPWMKGTVIVQNK